MAGIAVTGTDLDRATRLLTSAAERFAAAGDDAGPAVRGRAPGPLRPLARGRLDCSPGCGRWAERLASLPEASGLLAIGRSAGRRHARRGGRRAHRARPHRRRRRSAPTGAPRWPGCGRRPSWRWAIADSARRHVEVAVASTGPTLRGALSMLLVNAQTHSGDLGGGRRFAGPDAGRAGARRQRPQPGARARRWRRRGRRSPAASTTPSATWPAPASTPGPTPGPAWWRRCGEPRRPSPWPGATRPTAAELFAAADRRAQGRRRAASATGTCAASPLLYVLVPETREQFAGRRGRPVLPARPGPGRGAGGAAGARATWRRPPRCAGAAWATAPAVLPRRMDRRAGHRRRGRRPVGRAGAGHRHRRRRPADAAPPRRRRRGPEGGAHVGAHAGRRAAARAHGAAATSPCSGPPSCSGTGGRSTTRTGGASGCGRCCSLLLARGGGTREELAGALWPDLDTPARAAQPAGDAVVPAGRARARPAPTGRRRTSCGPRARRCGWSPAAGSRSTPARSRPLFDQAAEAEDQGEPSAALDLYRSGLRLYRGPYLTDAGYEEWALPHRDRLAARFVGGAVRAGELTLAGRQPRRGAAPGRAGRRGRARGPSRRTG